MPRLLRDQFHPGSQSAWIHSTSASPQPTVDRPPPPGRPSVPIGGADQSGRRASDDCDRAFCVVGAFWLTEPSRSPANPPRPRRADDQQHFGGLALSDNLFDTGLRCVGPERLDRGVERCVRIALKLLGEARHRRGNAAA